MSRLTTPCPSASSKPGKDVPANINDGPGLQSPSADEDMTSKAMRRAAIRNLDSPPEKKSVPAQSVVPHSPSSPSIPQPGMHSSCNAISFIPILNVSCVRNLSNLGYKLGNSSAECTLSTNA
jgi:hypothetical protein